MRTPTETSPYNLLQEQLRHDPWKLLVAVMMLNQTTAVQVKKVIWKFFEKYPDPYTFRQKNVTAKSGPLSEDPKWMEFVNLIRPLGFYNRRAYALDLMSAQFTYAQDLLYPPPQIPRIVPAGMVAEFHGIGKYAVDSYRMFIEGEIVEDAQDKELKNYVRWAHEQAQGGDRGEPEALLTP